MCHVNRSQLLLPSHVGHRMVSFNWTAMCTGLKEQRGAQKVFGLLAAFKNAVRFSQEGAFHSSVYKVQELQ